jgi:cell wall-associated NlpC family hydrolase
MPPPRFRSCLLALAVAVSAFGYVAPTASARLDGPPRRERPKPKPTLGQRAAKIAVKAVGIPYRWGGSSPTSGFDCSGLVYWAYGRIGVSVPHSSYALYGIGRSVRRSRLKAGDVLFFSGLGHVGLYIGRGRMVHAPQSGRNVEIVQLGRSHYGSRLVGARRLVT